MSATEMSMKPRVAAPGKAAGGRRRMLILGAATVVVLAAMVLDTTVVRIGSEQDARVAGFDPDSFGTKEFPRVRDHVIGKAPDAAELAQALAADKKAALAKYGNGTAEAMPTLPVRLTGTLGEGKAGIYDIAVEGVPDVRIRVQTGPAINGTDLRDVPGDIAFGQFKNQIEYQNAGAGLNRAMKAAVLDGLDTASLSGRQITLAGAFKLINPKMWLITPVEVEVK